MAKRQKTGPVKLRRKVLQDGSVSLYIDTYHGRGKRTYEFLKLHLTGGPNDAEYLHEAERQRAQRELEYYAGKSSVRARHVERQPLAEYLRIYAEGRPAMWGTMARRVAAYDARVMLGSIDAPWLRGFQNHLLATMRPNSVRGYMIRLLSALKGPVKKRHIDPDQLEGFTIVGKAETFVGYLTLEEVRALAAAKCGNVDLKRGFLFACYTGLRKSDIEALEWSQISGGRLRLRAEKTEAISYLPLSAQALELLGQPGKGRVFDLPTDTAIQNGLKVWARRAGLEKHLHFHMSRHTFATLVLTYGGDLYVVSQLLGHADISTTTIYAKVINERLTAAMDLIPPISVEPSR